MELRLGTRGSDLALWQANFVADSLKEKNEGLEVELVLIATHGDQSQEGPIGALGAQGVFTKEIQRALLDDKIDLAVHSLKDLPTDEIEGLSLAATPKRGPFGDVLVGRTAKTIDELPPNAVVGTGSLRRRTQLLHLRPNLQVQDIRGNVDTRLKKLDAGDYDAIVLAEAGLVRLGLADRITERIDPHAFLPAVGQGTIGIEMRVGDHEKRDIVRTINDAETEAAITAERTMLAELQGGCLAPIGAWGRVEGQTLVLTGRVLEPTGKDSVESTWSALRSDPASAGKAVAEELLYIGAGEFIEASRNGG